MYALLLNASFLLAISYSLVKIQALFSPSFPSHTKQALRILYRIYIRTNTSAPLIVVFLFLSLPHSVCLSFYLPSRSLPPFVSLFSGSHTQKLITLLPSAFAAAHNVSFSWLLSRSSSQPHYTVCSASIPRAGGGGATDGGGE